MTGKSESRVGYGLRRFAAVEGDMIVSRPPRRVITGIEFDTQFCRLILDGPDASGNEAYACKIADVSDEGFGIVYGASKTHPHPFNVGSHLTLEHSDGERVRVEVRWLKFGRLGLKRVASGPH